ncbi:MAG: hypothetical protein JWR50_2180 [Mucilaginibacter sp.]|nr:hypothetical protein [Mucilaginibacter sp.]
MQKYNKKPQSQSIRLYLIQLKENYRACILLNNNNIIQLWQQTHYIRLSATIL